MKKTSKIFMCLDILTRTKEWLHTYSFNAYEELFLGHRGCARISDASKMYPYLIDVQRDPVNSRLYLYRLNWENLTEAMHKLKTGDIEAYSFIKNKILLNGGSWQEIRLVAERRDDSVVMVEKLIDIKL